MRTIIRNPPVLRIASCGRSRTGKGAIEDPPTGTMSPGWVPLAHAKGRQETGQAVQSVAVSPHVRVRMTPRGQGSIAAAPPGWSLSVDGGDPGPGRRLRGEGLGRSPRAACRLLPASGRPASASPGPGPGPHRTQTLAPAPRRPRAARGLGRDRAIGGGEAFQRPPGSAPPPPRRRLTQSRCGAQLGREALPHHPGPRPAASWAPGTLLRLPDSSSCCSSRCSRSCRL